MHPRSLLCLAIVCFFLGLAGTAAAAQSFAVAPFTVHAPEKYHYLSDGIQSMITSRLSSQTKLQAKDAPQLEDAGKITRAKAREILEEAGLDYLVYGDVTMMGKHSSLSVKVLDRQDKLLTRTSQMPLEELIPSLNTMVGGIKQDLGFAAKQAQAEPARDVAAASEATPAEDQQPQKQPSERAKLNSQFEQREKVTKKKDTETLNPQFEQKKQAERTAGRWQSPAMPFTAIGMRVGDANGDGKEEILLLQDDAVKAFLKREDRLEHLATYDLGSRTRALNLNLGPAGEDGVRPVVVSALRDKKARSLILELVEDDFAVRADEIKLLFNVVRTPPEYAPRLVGQKLDAPGIFDNGVSLVERESGQYILGRTLDLPSAANVFNFAYLPREEGYRVIVADSTDSLRVYSSGGKLQASTERAFAGSEVKMQKKTSLPGLEDSREDPPRYYFLPTRLIPSNLDADGEFELLVNRSISGLSRFFANQRSYSKGEIHSLYWDGLGLSTAWKTRTIKGSVRDYGLGDMDNDNTLELYVCITTQSGMLSWDGEKTVVLAYPLDLPQETSRQTIFRP